MDCNGASQPTTLQEAVASPRRLAELRIQHQGSLADKFFSVEEQHASLGLLSQIIASDATLAEEIVRHDAFKTMSQHKLQEIEDDEDLHEVWCEILAFRSQLSKSRTSFTTDELVARLPMRFSFSSDINIMIHQVTDRQSAQSDVGFVLSDYIVRTKTLQSPRRILELGAGCGLTGLVAAAKWSNQEILLSDFNRTVVRNLERNIILNELSDNCRAIALDFARLEADTDVFLDMDGNPHEQVDLILGADVICQASDAQSIAISIHRLLKDNAQAILVSATADHRFGIDQLTSACETIPGLKVVVMDVETLQVSTLLEKTSGYVPAMKLQMFQISKVHS